MMEKKWVLFQECKTTAFIDAAKGWEIEKNVGSSIKGKQGEV